MRKALITLTSLLALALVVPAAALAGGGNGCPGGNSGVDEYTECVPGAGGHNPTSNPGGGGGSGGGGGGGSSLSPSATQALADQGAAGVAAANLAEATGPGNGSQAAGTSANGAKGGKGANGKGAKGDEGKAGQGGESAAGASSSDSRLGGISDTLTGSSGGTGMGILLPVILAVALVAAVGLLVARRLRSRSAHQA